MTATPTRRFRGTRIVAGLACFGAFSLAGCATQKSDQVRVTAIANEDEAPIPCAILVNHVVQLDASGAPIQTPATVPVTFDEDPTGAYSHLPTTIGVLALIEEGGKLRLPDRENDAPPYRYAERPVRPSDSKNQLFILVRNFDRRSFRIPKSARPPTQ